MQWEVGPRSRSPSREGREEGPIGGDETPTSSTSSSAAAAAEAAEDANPERPLLRRTPPRAASDVAAAAPVASAVGGGVRRRALSESCLPARAARSRSFGRDVGHAAAETFLLTRLALILLRYLG